MKESQYFLLRIFARATITPDKAPQDEEQIKVWVDPHKLKKINNIWYHQGQRVVTGDINEKRTRNQNQARPTRSRSPRHKQDGTNRRTHSLVATDEARRRGLHQRMRRLSTNES